MKIIYLVNQRIPTEKAYGIQIAKMCEAFASDGLDVTLLIPKRKKSSAEAVFGYYGLKINFKVSQVFSIDFYLPGKLDRLAFWIKGLLSAVVLTFYVLRSGVEMIYSRDELPLYLISLMSRKKLIFEAHGFSNNRKFFYAWLKKNDIKLVAITQGIKDDFIEFGIKPEMILVAHDGFDPAEFNNLIPAKIIREQVGLSINKPVVLYAGHLFPHKGADILAAVARTLQDFTFVFVGGTDEDLVDFRAKFGNMSNIFIVGQRTHQEALSFMMMADVLVLPNKKESGHTSPMKLFEYMASGRPIVASNLPSIREVLNEGNSVLVEPDNPTALAGGIKKILENNEMAENISRRAFVDVQKYTWKKRGRKIILFINHER